MSKIQQKRIRIGILGPSDIAFRRFLPAIKSSPKFEYVGVAIASKAEWSKDSDEGISSELIEKEKSKADNFRMTYGGDIYLSYDELISSKSIDALYIPLPPGLHYNWAKSALKAGKHILLEKPFTTNLKDTKEIIDMAKQKNLSLHENYAFCFHNQIFEIQKLIKDGEIGELRHIRAAFGFPYRGAVDFRYNKDLGGGALLDCGGYPVKLASLFLGRTSKIVAASLQSAKGHTVDVFGSATIENDKYITGHVAFGMDNSYKCELEIWGSEGCIYAPRIFTPPSDMKPAVIIKKQSEIVLETSMYDQFLGSAEHFYNCIEDNSLRIENYDDIERQSCLIEDIRMLGSKSLQA